MDLCIWILVISVIPLWLFYYYRKNKHDFRDWGIPQPWELPFLGRMGTTIIEQLHVSEIMMKYYNFNKDAKYIGIHSFMTPEIIVRDIDLIKTIMIKDFDHFSDRKRFLNDDQDPLLMKNLSIINGEKWREVRNLLSPAFTSNKMKMMFELMSNCAENFSESIRKQCCSDDAVNVKDAFIKYTNDVIATCAFGIEIDSMKDPTNKFYVYGKQATDIDSLGQIIAILKAIIMIKFSKLAKFLNIKLVPDKITNFFVDVIGTTIRTRDEKGITRPDMLQLMMDSRDKNKLDIIDMTAQAFVFFVAGFDTAASQMSLMAHEIAVNPGVQEKLQAEIDAVSEMTDGKVTYEAISNMPYLDAVFQETLRLHPQLAFLARSCSKNYELPPSLPGSKPYHIEPGFDILIPVSGIHRDPLLYEEPEKFNPERFVGKKMMTGDPTSLGFGIGPRMCIGNRFAVLETKVLFFYLLRKCSLAPCSKTCIPLKYSNKKLGPIPKEGFWLKINEK